MKNEDHVFEGRIKEFEQIFLKYVTASGIAKSTSPKMQLITGYLAIHGRLTQKQLRDLTGLSAGAISKNLRKILELKGFVRKEQIEGTNQYQYVITAMSEIAGRMLDIYSVEFLDIIAFLREKLEELQDHEERHGKELLSERIHEFIDTLQTMNDISSEIMRMFMPNT